MDGSLLKSRWQDMLKRGASPEDVLKEAERAGVDLDEVFAEAVPWFKAAFSHYMQKIRVSTGTYLHPSTTSEVEITLDFQRTEEHAEFIRTITEETDSHYKQKIRVSTGTYPHPSTTSEVEITPDFQRAEEETAGE